MGTLKSLPVDGAAIDERWELTEALAESIANWAEAQHYMQILRDPTVVMGLKY